MGWWFYGISTFVVLFTTNVSRFEAVIWFQVTILIVITIIIIIIIMIIIIEDFTNPAYHRVKLKEKEKSDKYLDLARKLKIYGT